MIFITGDTHGGIDTHKLSTKSFPQQRSMTKDDYVIICGDAGFVWDGGAQDRYWQKWMSDKTFTTLFVDGNHENFDALYKLPLTDKFGGAVREICPGLYHLERSQVLTIDGKKFFVMGGASSVDRASRREHVSWWPEEMPSRSEMERAIDALDAVNWEVDYVITHCAPKSVLQLLSPWFEGDPLTAFLERVRWDLRFKQWFFGHYHLDRRVNDRFTAVYNCVIPLPE